MGEANRGTTIVLHDDVSDRLDEMADLCEHWKRWREERSRTPQSIRAALVMLSSEVVLLDAHEKRNGLRSEPL